jgi:hypothetical protein
VTDYPMLSIFWTTMWFFLFVAWITVLVGVLSDVFRSADLSGPAKALWTLFLILLPWLGVVTYLISRGNNMHERRVG